MTYTPLRALPARLAIERADPGTRATSASSGADKIARTVVAAATLWFALALSWGLFGRVGAGHDAIVASRGIVADNMLSWHVWGPVRQYTVNPPGTDLYYAHHPWGSFWLIAGLAKVLGRHAYVPRLASILMSTATPPLLFAIGRALWGPGPGALAAVAYTVLPITLAFGNFPGFEVPLVFGCLLMTWGYLRFTERWRSRWMVVSLFGVLWSVNSDWEADVFIGAALACLFTAALLLPRRWFGAVDVRRFVRWWGLAVGIAIGTTLVYGYRFARLDALGPLFSQANARSRGNQTPLTWVLEARSYWIDLTFTPVAIAIGKVALVVLLARLIVGRRIHEVFPLCFCAMAVVEYVYFKNGADVHIYWPFPFGAYFALAVGVIAASTRDLALRVCRWRAPRLAPRVAPAVAGCVGFVVLSILPDGVTGLRYARMTGGRFDEKGRFVLRDIDKAQALEWMAARMADRGPVLIHGGMRPTWAQEWALGRPLQAVNEVPADRNSGGPRYFVADTRYLGSDDLRRLAERFAVIVVGPFVLADRAAPAAPIEAYSFDAREPTFFEWYLLSGVDPVRTVRADPWYTWELRAHCGQTENPPPAGEPATPEELRVAHNVAVAAGDEARAAAYREALVRPLDASVATSFTDGTQLLGERFARGVAPTLALYFQASGPAPSELQFQIDSAVEAKRRFSFVPADTKRRPVGEPFVLSPRLWRKGFIYSVKSEIRQRPGSERLDGFFDAPAGREAPRPATGAKSVLLGVLP
jgi:hypothetical protein